MFARGENPDGPGACLMEWCDLLIRDAIEYRAGPVGIGQRSAHPDGIEPVIALLGRRCNDEHDQERRDRMMPLLLPRVLAARTVTDRRTQARLSWAAVDGTGLQIAPIESDLLAAGLFTLAVSAALRGSGPGEVLDAFDGALTGYEKQSAEDGLLGMPPLVPPDRIERLVGSF